jgi:hypothetical protein
VREVHVDKLTLQAEGTNPLEVQRMARRVAELLGEELAGGQAVRPVREAIVNVHVPPGLGDDLLAEFVAREIRSQLG